MTIGVHFLRGSKQWPRNHVMAIPIRIYTQETTLTCSTFRWSTCCVGQILVYINIYAVSFGLITINDCHFSFEMYTADGKRETGCTCSPLVQLLQAAIWNKHPSTCELHLTWTFYIGGLNSWFNILSDSLYLYLQVIPTRWWCLLTSCQNV